MPPRARRVFISYAQESEAVRDLVVVLADRLRADGADAVIDRFVPPPEEGWTLWMARQIDDADKVIAVCTETWRRRYDRDEDPGVGAGVTWEAVHIRQQILSGHGAGQKFFAVVPADGDRRHVPAALRDAGAYVLWEDYDAVLRHIAERPEVVPGPIGDPTPARVVASDGRRSRHDEVQALEVMLLERHETEDDGRRAALTDRIGSVVASIADDSRARSGSQVAGCELIECVGEGSFGTVWRARAPTTGATVAVKVFHADRLDDGVMLWRFRRSIRAMQHLGSHRDAPRSIARVREVAEDTLAFTMDYFPNGSLSGVGRRRWTVDQKVAVFLDVCDAVAFAHRVGIVHRDIKPENVLLDGEQRAVLTDFDISDIKFVTRVAMDEGGIGTPAFAAPEQLVHGDSADERSDVYSLGRLLHYLLLERAPSLHEAAHQPLADLVRHPSALVDVVRKATLVDPGLRYDSVAMLRADVEGFRRRSARVRSQVRRAGRWASRHVALLVAMGLVTVSATAFTWQQRHFIDGMKALELKVGNTDRHNQELEATIIMMKARSASAGAGIISIKNEIGLANVVLQEEAPGSEEHASAKAQRASLVELLKREQQRQADLERRIAAAGDPREGSGLDMALAASDTTLLGERIVSPPEVETALRPRLARIEVELTSVDGPEGAAVQPGGNVTPFGPLWMSATEITQGQYAAVTSAHPSDPSHQGVSLIDDHFPVQQVSWFDALAFCNRLSQMEGLEQAYEVRNGAIHWIQLANGYRLPTEAEWERAALAGADGHYAGASVDRDLCEVANVADQQTGTAFGPLMTVDCDDGHPGLAPVASFAPNAWGLYDMTGNVWEWTWDAMGERGEAPTALDGGATTQRVLRGGGWYSAPNTADVAMRAEDSPDGCSNYAGFRVVRSILTKH